MADITGSFTFTVNNQTNSIIVGDNNPYIATGVANGETVDLYLKKLISPNGTVLHENPLIDGVPDVTYTFSGFPSGSISVPIPTYDDGSIQFGNYIVEFEAVVGSDNYKKDKTFTYLEYVTPTAELTITADTVTPLFTVEDTTDYVLPLYGDLEPSAGQSARLITIEFPDAIIADLTGTAATLSTATFYSKTQTVTLTRNLTYLIGDDSDFFIVDQISLTVEEEVILPYDLCTISALVDNLYAQLVNAENFSNDQANIRAKWQRAVGLLVMIREALSCGYKEGLDAYAEELKSLASYCDDVPATGDPLLISGLSAFDNNTVTIAYGTDLVGTDFSLNAFNGFTHIAFFTHNKKYTPIVSDFVGLWTEIPVVVGGGEPIPVSTDGLSPIEDNTEYTIGETIFNTISDAITFYYVNQTFTTSTPFDIDADITAGNLTQITENSNFTAILDYTPLAEEGGLGTTELIIYPQTIVVKDPVSKKLYRAKQDALNSTALTNTAFWELIVEDNTITESITQNLGESVGGINDQETFAAGTSNTELWKRLLTKIFNPTYTGPTFSLIKSANTLQKAGATVSFDLQFNFTRGSINGDLSGGIWNPALVQDFRAGAATSYTIDGVTQAGNNLSVSKAIAIGNQSYSGAVTYGVGPQPLDSAGENFETPLAGATSSAQTTTIEGVYPLFATTSAIATATEQTLLSMITANNIQKTLVAESGGNKQFFDIPNDWLSSRAITKVEFFNTVSGSFDTTNQLSTFTQTATTHTIEGNVINYTRFTNNTANRGSILIKIIF